MSHSTAGETSGAGPRRLSRGELILLACASAVVTANAYYIHPIIARVADDFGVSHAVIGAAPSLNQLALALGIFLLLPLGDRVSNRRLVQIFVTGQTLMLAVMVIAPDFRLFVGASTVLGFFTIAPYLLPAYVSKRVDSSQLGEATALLTTGVIAGVLFARTGGGIVAEHFGWRTVYIIATILMAAMAVALPMVMDEREQGADAGDDTGYLALLGSIAPIVRRNPEILISGAIQGLGFGIFLAVWLGLGLHLTSPEMGYGVDVVGYLSALAILNMVSTPFLGRWADSLGARRARVYAALGQGAAVVMFYFAGHSLWLLIPPIMLMNAIGPLIDVAGRMTFLNQEPAIRTRLMTVYIVLMFVGAGFSSWGATAAYDWSGWRGAMTMALGLSVLVVGLCVAALKWKGPR